MCWLWAGLYCFFVDSVGMNNFKLLPRVDQKKTKKTTSRGHVRLGLGTTCKQLLDLVHVCQQELGGLGLNPLLQGWDECSVWLCAWLRECHRPAFVPFSGRLYCFFVDCAGENRIWMNSPRVNRKKTKKTASRIGWRKRCQRRQVWFSCIRWLL